MLRAALIVLLLLPATASASRLDSRVQHDFKVADRQWPQSGCVGREQVVWDGTATLSAWTELGDTVTCVIHVEPELQDSAWSTDLCKVLVHEAGHLAGMLHSPSRRSIMFEAAPEVRYAPCEAPRHGRARASHATRRRRRR